MNRPSFAAAHGFLAIDGLAKHVEHAAQHPLSYGDAQIPPGIDDAVAPAGDDAGPLRICPTPPKPATRSLPKKRLRIGETAMQDSLAPKRGEKRRKGLSANVSRAASTRPSPKRSSASPRDTAKCSMTLETYETLSSA
jgi:hypothetical protein